MHPAETNRRKALPVAAFIQILPENVILTKATAFFSENHLQKTDQHSLREQPHKKAARSAPG
jgi:hypothetical protein